MQKELSLIQGSCGLTIFLSEKSDLVSQSLLVCPHSGNLFVKAIFVSCRHGRHGILRFLEVLKERPKTLSPLDALQNRVVKREAKSPAQDLTPRKKSRQSPLENPLTFLSDWEESPQVFLKMKILNSDKK
jgi:hypothetical protein